MENKIFVVPNISCGHCVATIQDEVSALGGVTAVKANQETKEVSVSWNTPANWEQIKSLLQEIDYAPAE